MKQKRSYRGRMMSKLSFTCTNSDEDIPYKIYLSDLCVSYGINMNIEQNDKKTKYTLTAQHPIAVQVLGSIRSYLGSFF
jgi:hypothetical protein